MRPHPPTDGPPSAARRLLAVDPGAPIPVPVLTAPPPRRGPAATTGPSRPPGPGRLEAAYRAHHAPMVRLAHLLVGSQALAEELVHDSFLKLHGALDRVEGEPGPYLRTIVVNQCRSHLRRRQVEERHARHDDRVALPPELDEVREHLRALPERRRTALVLRFYEDMSIDEIAHAMGCRPGTVKSLVHRGLAAMRKELS